MSEESGSFKLDDSTLRNNLSESELDNSWEHRGGKDKKNGGYKRRVICPECGHHAFEYSTTDGRFICWYCHLWGRLKEYQKERTTMPLSPYPLPIGRGSNYHNQNKANKNSMTQGTEHSEYTSPSGRLGGAAGGSGGSAGGSYILSDYMPLSDEELEDIEEISTDEQVSGNQLVAREYLQEIGLTPEFANRQHLGIAKRYIKCKDEDKGKERLAIAFRNYVDGYCCNVKFRSITAVVQTKMLPGNRRVQHKHREKGFDQLSSFTPCAPYNIDCIRPEGEEMKSGLTLIITEGEKDCLTLLQIGYEHVISVASGANTDHRKSFMAFRPWLEQVSTVILCGDQDWKGRQMTEQLSDYFDSKVVRVVSWDQRLYGKDINEVCLNEGADFVQQLISEAVAVEREDILTFRTEAKMQLVAAQARGEYDKGYDVGIGPVTDKHFHLNNQGGLIILTGTPNAGKTDFLNYLCTRLIAVRDKAVCFCSFETPDKARHLGEMSQVWAGPTKFSRLSEKNQQAFVDVITSHVTHLDIRRDSPTPARIMQKAESAMQMMPGIEYLIIDPYLYVEMQSGYNVKETDAIKAMLTEFQDWAHEHHVWVFIVAHPRKLNTEDGAGEYEEINMYSISGSANWANIADFIVSLKRVNKPKHGMEFTQLSVLKVRDQKLCSTGDVYYERQSCGRYDERETKEQCMRKTGKMDLEPYSLNSAGPSPNPSHREGSRYSVVY